MEQTKIILASRSPRRAALLCQIGVSFSIKESNFLEAKEILNPTVPIVKEMVIKNAKGKALDVAREIEEGIVLGVDTLVLCKNKILGKPKDKKTALWMLKFINGQKHKIFSGIALVKKFKGEISVLTDCEVATVFMRKASDDELKNYVSTGESLDKAGGYGIQEKGAIFIERIEGDYYNVVGLPIIKLLNLAKKMKIVLV